MPSEYMLKATWQLWPEALASASGKGPLSVLHQSYQTFSISIMLGDIASNLYDHYYHHDRLYAHDLANHTVSHGYHRYTTRIKCVSKSIWRYLNASTLLPTVKSLRQFDMPRGRRATSEHYGHTHVVFLAMLTDWHAFVPP